MKNRLGIYVRISNGSLGAVSLSGFVIVQASLRESYAGTLIANGSFSWTITRLRIAAKVTHAKYGASSHPATGTLPPMVTISAATDNHSPKTSTSAQSGRRSLKKRPLQPMLKAPLRTKSATISERASSLGAAFHARTAAQTARAKISVHAGPNSHSRGCHDGFLSARYQGPISVSKPPIPATATAPAAATATGIQPASNNESMISYQCNRA